MTLARPHNLLAEILFGTESNASLSDPAMACLAGFLGGVRAAVAQESRDDRQTQDLLEPALVNELEPHAIDMAWHLDQILTSADDAEVKPDAADAFVLGRAYATARLTVADPTSRLALRNITVWAFERQIFAAGISIRAFQAVLTLETATVADMLDGTPTGPIGPVGGLSVDVLTKVIRTPKTTIPEGWVVPWERTLELSL